MISTTQDYKDAIYAPSRTIKTKIIVNSTTTYTGEDDLISLTHSENLENNLGLSIGMTPMSELSFSLYNQIIGNNVTVKAYAGIVLPSGTTEWIQLGVFYTASRETPDNGLTYKYICYDAMNRVAGKYNPTISFPAQASAVLNDIATQCNIELSTISWGDSEPTLDRFYSVTCRDYIGYIAGLMGKSARFNREGKLEFVFYGNSAVTTIPEDGLYMNGAKFEDSITYSSLTSGTVDSTLTSGTGRAITFHNPYMTQTRLDTIKAASVPLTLVPATVDKWRGDPSLQCGDRVVVNGKSILVMQKTISINGGMKGSIDSFGASDLSYNLEEAPKDKELKQAYSKLQEAIADAQALIDGSKGGIFQMLDSDQDGINDGFIIADNQDISQAQKLIKANSQGIALSNNGGSTYSTAITGDGISANSITGGIIDGELVTAKNLLVQGLQLDPNPPTYSNATSLINALIAAVDAQETDTMKTWSAIYSGSESEEARNGIQTGMNVFCCYKHTDTSTSITTETTFIIDHATGLTEGNIRYATRIKRSDGYQVRPTFGITLSGTIGLGGADIKISGNLTSSAKIPYTELYPAIPVYSQSGQTIRDIRRLTNSGWYFETDSTKISGISGLPSVAGTIQSIYLEVFGEMPFRNVGISRTQKLIIYNTDGEHFEFQRPVNSVNDLSHKWQRTDIQYFSASTTNLLTSGWKKICTVTPKSVSGAVVLVTLISKYFEPHEVETSFIISGGYNTGKITVLSSANQAQFDMARVYGQNNSSSFDICVNVPTSWNYNNAPEARIYAFSDCAITTANFTDYSGSGVTTRDTAYFEKTGTTNGINWQRNDDGTLIQWGEISFSGINFSSTWGSLYTTGIVNKTTTFPIAFTSKPSLSLTFTENIASGSHAVMIMRSTHNNTAITNYEFARGTSATATFKLSFIAVGRWK